MAQQDVFADYVLKNMPTSSDVSVVLAALGRLLRHSMRYRGVWGLAPSVWGYAGKSWREDETFNDLLFDCFAHIFDGEKGKRLAKLREYARQTASIGGVVRTMVYNFLNDIEKKRDPTSHAIFKNIQTAVASAISDGRLVLETTSQERITNASIVATSKGIDKIELDALYASLSGWSEFRSVCDSMMKRSARGQMAAERLIGFLLDKWPSTWRVGDLVDTVKRTVPRQIPGLFDKVVSSIAAQGSPTGQIVEDDEVVNEKSRRTEEAIDALTCHTKVKIRLLHLWGWIIGYYRKNLCFPKQSEVVETTGLPRQRVNDDYIRLRPLLSKIWEKNPDK
jgi:hypothetical protein